MEIVNVLIFPAGSENAINAYKALCKNLHFQVYGASGKDDYARAIYPKDRLRVSTDYYISNPSFVESINKLIAEWDIKFIIPTHDVIVKALLEKQHDITATIVSSPLETAVIAEDKAKMYQTVFDADYCPTIFTNYSDLQFPVFVKPRVGAGGKGTRIIYDVEQLDDFLLNKDNYVISEFLPGEELTVDCFTNKEGELLFFGARTRERVTNGISFRSRRVKNTPEIQAIAEDLNRRLFFRGAWYFQIKKDKHEKWKLLEFSVRMSGTMLYYMQLGVNFPALSLFDFMGFPVHILCNDVQLILDRGIETSFILDYVYDTLYIDYDDTLIVNNKVNTTIIKVIFQAINKGKEVILLTKHIGDLRESLAKYHLSIEMFHDIILLHPNERKADYIKSARSVLIDNYFPERMDVISRCGIPVFDVDAATCLIDSRDI